MFNSLRDGDFNPIDFIKSVGGVVLVSILLFLFLFGVSFANYVRGNSFTSDIERLTAERNTAQQELNSIQAQAPEIINVDSVDTHQHRAVQLGEQLAELQNEYKKIPVSDTDGLVKHAEKIDTYLSVGSSAMRVPWYNTDVASVGPWRFITPYFFTQGKADVLWLLNNEDNETVAYVEGVYDVQEEIFDKLNVVVTAKGNSLVEATYLPHPETDEAREVDDTNLTPEEILESAGEETNE